MFARSVSLHLKPSRVEEFTRIIENEVIPMMRSLLERVFMPVLLLALLWPTPAGYYLRLGVAACVAALWVLQANRSKYLGQAAYTTASRKVKYEN
jgi:hypothetical protein